MNLGTLSYPTTSVPQISDSVILDELSSTSPLEQILPYYLGDNEAKWIRKSKTSLKSKSNPFDLSDAIDTSSGIWNEVISVCYESILIFVLIYRIG